MKYEDLVRLARGQVVRFSMETGRQFRPEHFALDLHPRDWSEVGLTMPWWHGMPSLDRAEGLKLMGIPLREDWGVEPGHPILRSTWQVTL